MVGREACSHLDLAIVNLDLAILAIVNLNSDLAILAILVLLQAHSARGLDPGAH